jgi:hypothetical protein
VRIWGDEPQAPLEHDPGAPWERQRSVIIECPEAQLIFDNVAAGPVPFQPGSLERIDLPAGPGAFTVRVATQGRNDIRQLIATALADEADGDVAHLLETLYGHEQYLIDVWRTGPLSEDDP